MLQDKRRVYMKVTREQWETDLRDRLRALGYVDKVGNFKDDFVEYTMLVNDYNNFEPSDRRRELGMIDECHWRTKNVDNGIAVLITEYNPELYIELASEDEPHNLKFPFELNEADAKRIVGVACDGWKFRLSKEWGPALLTDGHVMITEHRYKEMREACTPSQHELFDEIFGKYEACPYKDGELIFVRDNPQHPWLLRYSTGKLLGDTAVTYPNQEKSGNGFAWQYHAPAPGVKLPE